MGYEKACAGRDYEGTEVELSRIYSKKDQKGNTVYAHVTT